MPINGLDFSTGNDQYPFQIFAQLCLSSWISHLLHISQQQKTLNLVDLYDLLPQFESTTLTETLERNWFNELKRYPHRPNLLRATICTMGWKPLLTGLLLLPFVSEKIIRFKTFSPPSIPTDFSLHYSTLTTHISNEFFRTMFNHARLASMDTGDYLRSHSDMQKPRDALRKYPSNTMILPSSIFV